jgi:hypothetical protein
LVLGLLLLSAPIHWEWFLCADRSNQQQTEYSQPFTHGENVSQIPRLAAVGGETILDMGKNGKKGGGGSAHERAIARASAGNPQNLTSLLSPLGLAEQSPAPVSPPQQPTSIERIFTFLENGIVLTVMGTVGGLAGVFIDGKYLLFLCIPIALGLHRSRALAGTQFKTMVLAHLTVFAISALLLWVVGEGVNRSREHIPTAKEIGDYVVEHISGKEKPIAALDTKPKTTMKDQKPIQQPKRTVAPPPDPNYPPPKGPLVRFDGNAEPQSSQMCQGMSDASQIDCLCPSPLHYTLHALPSPSDNNYATEIDIKKTRRPFYRIRVFSRTAMVARYGHLSIPPNDAHSSSFLESFDYDPYSVVYSRTAPTNELKITVHSSEGMRLKCINQEN